MALRLIATISTGGQPPRYQLTGRVFGLRNAPRGDSPHLEFEAGFVGDHVHADHENVAPTLARAGRRG